MHSLAGGSPHRDRSIEQHKKSRTPERTEEQQNTPEHATELADTLPSTPLGGATGMGIAATAEYSPHSSPHSSTGSTSVDNGSQQFCLRWNNYQSNLTSVFDQLLQTEAFVDVTLACDGRSIKAHKMVLSACSPYFQTLFSTTPCQHPIVIMRDVNWLDLKAIVDFMYKGEINVRQDQIGPLLNVAEMLKVRGLADVGHISAASETAQLSTKTEPSSTDKESYSPSHNAPTSPKIRKKSLSPFSKRSQSGTQGSPEHQDPMGSDMDLLVPMEGEKNRLRVEAPSWDLSMAASTTARKSLALRLSPLQHQQHQSALIGKNVRKRRWPSADTLFNPPESPLGSLIAAERAEQERHRERGRDRERSGSLFTPPMPVISGSSSSVLEPSIHLEFPSPSPTPTLLPPARTPSALLTSASPHMQISQHHQQQQQSHQHQRSQHTPSHSHVSGGGGRQSHSSSPASSVTSTHPSSILSRPLTPSPASVSGSGGVGSRLDPDRFPLGPAQAAAMLDLSVTAAASMGMRSLPSSGSAMAPGSSHHGSSLADDLEIKPGIAEMIREEERVSLKIVLIDSIE